MTTQFYDGRMIVPCPHRAAWQPVKVGLRPARPGRCNGCNGVSNVVNPVIKQQGWFKFTLRSRDVSILGVVSFPSPIAATGKIDARFLGLIFCRDLGRIKNGRAVSGSFRADPGDLGI